MAIYRCQQLTGKRVVNFADAIYGDIRRATHLIQRLKSLQKLSCYINEIKFILMFRVEVYSSRTVITGPPIHSAGVKLVTVAGVCRRLSSSVCVCNTRIGVAILGTLCWNWLTERAWFTRGQHAIRPAYISDWHQGWPTYTPVVVSFDCSWTPDTPTLTVRLLDVESGGLFTIGRTTGLVSDVRRSYAFRATSKVINETWRTYDRRTPGVNMVVNLRRLRTCRTTCRS